MNQLEMFTESAKSPLIVGSKTYTISSTEGNSSKYGPCEVCGKHCTEVFIKQSFQDYSFVDNYGKYYSGKSNKGSSFGHKDCLLKNT